MVSLACHNALPEDLARMRTVLLAMDDPEISREIFNQLDIEYHVEIAEASGNRLMSDVTRAIRESVRIPFLDAVTAMPEDGEYGWPLMLNHLRADHHGLFAAIEAGQEELAADLVEAHIHGFYRNLIAAT